MEKKLNVPGDITEGQLNLTMFLVGVACVLSMFFG